MEKPTSELRPHTVDERFNSSKRILNRWQSKVNCSSDLIWCPQQNSIGYRRNKDEADKHICWFVGAGRVQQEQRGLHHRKKKERNAEPYDD